MNFPQLRSVLKARLQHLNDATTRADLIARFDALRDEHLEATTTPERRAEIEAEINDLEHEAAALTRPVLSRTAIGMISGLVIAAVIGCFILIFFYFTPFGVEKMNSPTKIGEFIIASSVIMLVTFGGAVVLYRVFGRASGGILRGDAPGQGFWNKPTMALASIITILFFGGIALYMSALEGDISSVRSTRPILVFTLIVAMLGFGGLLIVRSLFSTGESDALEKRFRLAREIFLVYAGIFGTIIGFYFGAADEGEDRPPAITLAGSADTLSAQVSGGSPPFIGLVQRSDPALNWLMAGTDRLLSAKLDLSNMGDGDGDRIPDGCGVGATVTIVDGRGRRASADVTGEMFVGTGLCAPPVTAGADNAAAETNDGVDASAPPPDDVNAQ